MTYRIGDERIAITTEEFNILDSMLKSGDRAGYYMAYYGIAQAIAA